MSVADGSVAEYPNEPNCACAAAFLVESATGAAATVEVTVLTSLACLSNCSFFSFSFCSSGVGAFEYNIQIKIPEINTNPIIELRSNFFSSIYLLVFSVLN